MRIVIQPSLNINGIEQYLDFNRIPFEKIDLWDRDLHEHSIARINAQNSRPCLLILDADIFRNLMAWPRSRQGLLDFCQYHVLWVWNDIDGFLQVNKLRQEVVTLDKEIPSGSIRLFFDDHPSSRNWVYQLKNISWVIKPYCAMLGFSARIRDADVTKNNCTKDFLLTMIRKKTAMHRNMLWSKLQAVPNLLDRGYAVFHSRASVRPIGDQKNDVGRDQSHPSMDLYRDSWFEIVPETFYKDGYSLSEKTTKSFITKTPFMVASSCGYLDFLKNKFGFRTFGHLIDESYDLEYRVQDRLDKMIQQMIDVIKNGSHEFYRASADVLEHNQARILEILGRYQYDNDVFIHRELQRLDQK
jgi:hypothetical protein